MNQEGEPHESPYRDRPSFDYAGPLTEAVLLGTVSTFFPKTTLEWDGPGLKFANCPEANRHIRRTYRHGWDVKGLS